MHRCLLPLLFLICFSWMQGAAAPCIQGPVSPEPEGEHAHHDVHHPATQGDHGEEDRSAPVHHGGAGCAMLMTCGVAVAPAPEIVPVLAATVSIPAVLTPTAAYASPSLATDPPPPRFPV